MIAIVAVASVGVVAGCDDDSSTVATAPSSAGSPSAAGSRPSSATPGRQPAEEAPVPPGRRVPRETVTTADGAVVSLPARPRRLVAAPSPSCTAEAPGGREFLPPRPGARATRVGARRIVVEISFEDVPARCRPYGVRITVDVNGDPLPPSAHRFPFGDTERPLAVELPERVAKADVVYASSVMRSGASSDSTAVLIGRPDLSASTAD